MKKKEKKTSPKIAAKIHFYYVKNSAID